MNGTRGFEWSHRTAEAVWSGCSFRDQLGVRRNAAMSRTERNPPFICFFFLPSVSLETEFRSCPCGEQQAKKDRLGFQPAIRDKCACGSRREWVGLVALARSEALHNSPRFVLPTKVQTPLSAQQVVSARITTDEHLAELFPSQARAKSEPWRDHCELCHWTIYLDPTHRAEEGKSGAIKSRRKDRNPHFTSPPPHSRTAEEVSAQWRSSRFNIVSHKPRSPGLNGLAGLKAQQPYQPTQLKHRSKPAIRATVA